MTLEERIEHLEKFADTIGFRERHQDALCREIQDKLTEFNKIVRAIDMRVRFNDKGEARLAWEGEIIQGQYYTQKPQEFMGGGLSRSRDCEQKTSAGIDVV